MAQKLLQLIAATLCLICLGFAIALFVRGYGAQSVARFAEAQSGQFSSTTPFAAEGKIDSDSHELITSLHSRSLCLGYWVKVDFCYLTADGDDSEREERKTIFDRRNQVPGLGLVFQSGGCKLDLEMLKSSYGKPEGVDALPAYVTDEGLPDPAPKTYWFEVSETLFLRGQKVTAVGQVDEFETLAPLPDYPEPIVYPGDRSETVKILKAAGKRDIIFGLSLIGLGLAVGLLLRLIVKHNRSGQCNSKT